MWRRALRPAVAGVDSGADLRVVFRAAANLFWFGMLLTCIVAGVQ